MAEPIANAAAARVKWSRDPKVRAQQVKNPNYHPPAHHAAHAAPARRQPSLIEMTPAQIADRAKRIVNAEVSAERLPFQQRSTQLGGEEASTLAAHAKDYGQLEASTKNLATQNAESAKTFQNTAAEMVKKAEQQAPGAAASAEHGATGSEASKQQEAARNLLTAIATGAQAGTNARQQSESNFLTNLQGTAAQENAAGGKQISGEYGKKKTEVANQEAQINAGKQGRVGKLILNTEGEQEKLKLAAGTLGNNQAKTKIAGETAHANIRNQKATLKLNERKLSADEAYKKASLSDKEAKTRISASKAAGRSKVTGPGGKPLPAASANKIKAELGGAFAGFEALRSEGVEWGTIRRDLTRGYQERKRQVKGETSTGETTKTQFYKRPLGKVQNQVLLTAAEQIYRYHHIDPKIRAQLGHAGIEVPSDPEFYEQVTGRPYTPPQPYKEKQPTGLHSPAHRGK